MQGSWLVKVKSKSAAYAQQFMIQGATIGNGTYTGSVATPEVFATGSNWSITILNNPGSGYVPSEMQIKFPVSSGGFYSFDIESNDNFTDEDFNDLILTCRTPVDADDYIIYGNVAYYSGNCFNPCGRRFIVIDSLATLLEATRNPILKDLIATYYPKRINDLKKRVNFVSLNPQPLPPGPDDLFSPMVIPLSGTAAIPEKQRLLVKSKPATLEFNREEKAQDNTTFSFNRLLSVEKMASANVATNALIVADKTRIEAAGIADRFRYFCETGSLPSAILNVIEYDRSSGELAGAAYTGDGDRENLGQVVTDRNGNYIFRFRMSGSQVADEITSDTAEAEDTTVQSAPDIMLQLMCLGSSIPAFETAPDWNISHLHRLDVCVPKAKSCLIPMACDGQHIIQGIGNIVLGPPTPGGQRIGSNNYLNTSGIITAYGSGAPAARCSAWYGTLQLRGCLSNAAVKYYRLWHKPNFIFASYVPFTQQFALPHFVGPNVVNGLVYDTVKNAYLNVENDPAGNWLYAYRNIKARIDTTASGIGNGSHLFKIQGLDEDLNPVDGTEETVVLYIDNGSVQSDINTEITMDGVGTLGECALFTLPEGNEAPGITVKFRATHNVGGTVGFMNSYGLSMMKGASGFAFSPGAAPAIFPAPPFLDGVANSGRNYVHGDNLDCNTYFRGTVNEITADSDNYYSVTLTPASGGWLEPGQPFCAFGIYLSYQLRLTNGEVVYPNLTTSVVLIGIQRPTA